MSAQSFIGVFQYSRRAIELVWQTSRPLACWMAILTLIAGAMPAAIAYVGKLIVDAVVIAMEDASIGLTQVYIYVAWEAGLVVALAAAQRGIAAAQSLLRARLGQRVNEMILDKAQTLSLAQFEDSEFYDKLTRARREASQRPMALVTKTFGLIQNFISIASFAALLVQFSPWAPIILVVAALPGFVAEAKFSNDAYQLFRWRSQDRRMQMYLETVLAREDSIKEVQLFDLGDTFLGRYKSIFHKIFAETRALTIRRESWGWLLGVIGSAGFYGAYAWVVFDTVSGRLTLGDMTMYLLVFKQGQAAVAAMLTAISGMYEDNLYLSNLYEYLEQDTLLEPGHRTEGDKPGDGIRFIDVSFAYPGANKPALTDINLHLSPGQSLALVGENGSGKTTLIKLMTRLYKPTQGQILLDGTNLQEWSVEALRKRVGVIFQDFVRYQLQVGENIGAGDVEHFNDQERWHKSAEKGQAAPFIKDMPQGYQTQLGRWFQDGQELSGGQWQKVALSRAFMREGADLLVLDEPTAAMDAQAEADIFAQFQSYARDKMAILISHRFSTVRYADHIVVMEHGQILERGNHKSLVAENGRYAHLFNLQAEGYR